MDTDVDREPVVPLHSPRHSFLLFIYWSDMQVSHLDSSSLHHGRETRMYGDEFNTFSPHLALIAQPITFLISRYNLLSSIIRQIHKCHPLLTINHVTKSFQQNSPSSKDPSSFLSSHTTNNKQTSEKKSSAGWRRGRPQDAASHRGKN